MRSTLLFFLICGFIFIAFPVKAQENHGLLSIQVPSAVSNETNRQQASITKFEVEQNSPNPFTDYTQIEYASPVQGFMEFKIVNLIGKEIFHRVMETEAGRNTIRFEGDDFTPGVYIYSLSNGSQTITRRMVISKK